MSVRRAPARSGRPRARLATASLAGLLALAGAAAVAAGNDDVAKAAKAGLDAWKKGDAARAAEHLERALEGARAKAPLVVREAAVIRGKHQGLGVYDPVPGGVVDGRAMSLYVEVANFDLGPSEGGTRRVGLEVTGAFAYDDVDERGRVERVELGEKSLGVHEVRTRAGERVTSFGLDVGLGERAPAGTYHLVLTVKDVVGGKTATKPLSFVLR